MKEITVARAEEVGEHIKILIEAMNSIGEDDLKALIDEGRRKESIGPFIDPTRYQMEADDYRKGIKFLNCLFRFKLEVKGIGNCR